MRFAGVAGSPIHRELISGETVYLRYVLRKPSGVARQVEDKLAKQ